MYKDFLDFANKTGYYIKADKPIETKPPIIQNSRKYRSESIDAPPNRKELKVQTLSDNTKPTTLLHSESSINYNKAQNNSYDSKLKASNTKYAANGNLDSLPPKPLITGRKNGVHVLTIKSPIENGDKSGKYEVKIIKTDHVNKSMSLESINDEENKEPIVTHKPPIYSNITVKPAK